VNFGIYDGENDLQNPSWFTDNFGTITVDIYKGYAGTTGKDGCVTWQNVPYGTYAFDEQMQDGWKKVSSSGNGTVVVDSPAEQLSIVNARIVDECRGDDCDNPPSGSTTGSLAVDFVVTGGSLNPATLSATVGSDVVTESISLTGKTPGAYTVVAGTQSGYNAPTYSGGCTSAGVITVSAGATSTCIITYTLADVPPTGGPGGGGGPTTNSFPGFDSNGSRSRRGGSVLGASTSIPEGEVLGASTELPGLPNTGTAPLNNTTEAVTLLAMIIALAGVNLIALRSDRKEA
jgi:hypothetical protein